jgi:hypothetical protein
MDFSLQELATLYAVCLSSFLAFLELKRRHAVHVSYFIGKKPFFSPKNNLSLLVTVTNRGLSKTTIEALHFKHWKNQTSYLFRKKPVHFFVKLNELPKSIDPGNRWQAELILDQEKEEFFKNGITHICVKHSMANKPVIKRVSKKV